MEQRLCRRDRQDGLGGAPAAPGTPSIRIRVGYRAGVNSDRINHPRGVTPHDANYSRTGRLATVLVLVDLVGRRREADEPIRIIVFGAHPDDCELDAGGTAARWAKLGHKVKFVSTTNGDIGHHQMAGGILARRRKPRSRSARRSSGSTTEVLDNHDGELMPTLENRKTLVKLIREWKADVVIGPRTNDYHPDHRYTGILVQDAAFMVIVPNFCPDVPALRKNPVFLYTEDDFKKPNTFEPDVVVPIDAASTPRPPASTPSNRSSTSGTPGSPATRARSPRARPSGSPGPGTGPPSATAATADEYRPKLVEWLGAEKARAVKAAEAFEVCEYGSQPSKEELKRSSRSSARRSDRPRAGAEKSFSPVVHYSGSRP